MNFELVQNILSTLIKTIENSSIAVMKTIKAQTYPVKVTNPVKKVDVKGTVIVGNQRKVEDKLKDLNKLQKQILDGISVVANSKYDVTVLNPQTQLDINNLEVVSGEVKKTNTLIPEITNGVQSLHKYIKEIKEIEVSNQPTKELGKIEKAVAKLEKAIGKLKLNPSINVAPANIPDINIPAPIVKVEKQEIDYSKFGQAINIPEINYTKLAKIIAKEISGMVITSGGGGSSFAFRDQQGNRGRAVVDDNGHILVSSQDITAKYQIADKDEGETNKYYGFTDADGAWYILNNNVTNNTYRYIKGDSAYTSNWTNRASLSYNYYHLIF